jgi:Flp pilus assembly pilin Flp
MRSWLRKVLDSAKKRRGQTLVEYALIFLVVVLVIMMAAWSRLSDHATSAYDGASSGMTRNTP